MHKDWFLFHCFLDSHSDPVSRDQNGDASKKLDDYNGGNDELQRKFALMEDEYIKLTFLQFSALKALGKLRLDPINPHFYYFLICRVVYHDYSIYRTIFDQ